MTNNSLQPVREAQPIRVAIYVRVSSDRQDIYNSVEAQIAECRRYASHNNMVVVVIYREEARAPPPVTGPSSRK